jgi:hypothetical protein
VGTLHFFKRILHVHSHGTEKIIVATKISHTYRISYRVDTLNRKAVSLPQLLVQYEYLEQSRCSLDLLPIFTAHLLTTVMSAGTTMSESVHLSKLQASIQEIIAFCAE